MQNESTNNHHIFPLLEGTWTGEGRGDYPTITSFNYRETLAFTRRDEKSLAYEQKTQKRLEGQTEYVVSHWENGLIHIRFASNIITNDPRMVSSVRTFELEGGILRYEMEMQTTKVDQ